MRRQRISETINNLSETIIQEGATYQKNKNTWIKWTAIAASFALILGISIPAFKNKTSHDDLIDSVWMIEYDNAYYEIIEDNLEALEKFGVPTKITADLAGEHVGYLKSESPDIQRSILLVTDEKTDIELLEYNPAPNKAHLIIRHGEKYYIARICNYITMPNDSHLVSEFLKIYGINSAEDIKSVAPTSWDNTWKLTGKAVTDRAKITEFYNELINLKPFSEDEFQKTAYNNNAEDEESLKELYTGHANDLKVIVIETKDGIRFTIKTYPTYGWFYFPATLTHAQMPATLKTWLEINMK